MKTILTHRRTGQEITVDYPPIPKTVAAIIRLAKKDLMKTLKMPDLYEINMGEWHSPDSERQDGKALCCVCFAGSVMAQTIKLDVNSFSVFAYQVKQDQSDFKEKESRHKKWEVIFDYLDSLRKGYASPGYLFSVIPSLKQSFVNDDRFYRDGFEEFNEENPTLFFKWLNSVIKKLEQQRTSVN